jgi:YhcH/YjgK/YiaL family protein
MIVDRLKNWRRYAGLAELRPAFEFLERHGGEDLPQGRIEIDGDRLFALPQRYPGRAIADGRFESHHRYADVQYIAGGAEMIGYAPVETLQVEKLYDPAADIEFYAIPACYTPIALPAGSFAVFYPHDGHMPCCRLDTDGPIYKIVVKINLGKVTARGCVHEALR